MFIYLCRDFESFQAHPMFIHGVPNQSGTTVWARSSCALSTESGAGQEGYSRPCSEGLCALDVRRYMTGPRPSGALRIGSSRQAFEVKNWLKGAPNTSVFEVL